MSTSAERLARDGGPARGEAVRHDAPGARTLVGAVRRQHAVARSPEAVVPGEDVVSRSDGEEST